MLTIEDVITSGLNDVNEFYEIDTSLVDTQAFSAISYDFCVISHSISGSNHTYQIEVHNTLWKGMYYFLDNNGDYIDSDATYDSASNTFTLTCSSESVKVGLYLTIYTESFNFERTNLVFKNNLNPSCMIPLSDVGESYQIIFTNLSNGNDTLKTVTLATGVNEIDNLNIYYECFVLKTNVEFDTTPTSLEIGVNNKVPLRVNSKYLPDGSLVSDVPLNIEVLYNGNILEVAYDETLEDYCFELDLSGKLDKSSETVTIKIYENDLVKAHKFNRTYRCNYVTISSFEELNTKLVQGVNILNLTSNIVFSSNLTIPNDLSLLADNHQIDLAGYHIKISHDKTLKINDAQITHGNPCIVQDYNSKLNLQNCNFKDSTINDTMKGSCIYTIHNNTQCDINNCFFNNCHHTIYHAGTVNIENSKALFNIWNTNIDTDYSAFITMFDGNLNIIDSTFDIDYDITSLCSNEIDIKFASSLIGVGEDTILNGYSTPRINKNDGIPLWDYGNQSHIFIKYYYTDLETCVIMSPILGKENKSTCHTILGTDYVFKNNVQITTVSSENENNIRTITWE